LYLITENKEGVIYEDDSEDDEDYVWADHLEPAEGGSISEIEANSEIDANHLDLMNQIRTIMSIATYQMMRTYLKLLMIAKSVFLRGFNMRQRVSVVVMGK
jgi:hypothetical protein